MKHKSLIPTEYYVGGQRMEVVVVERCPDNNFGNCFVGTGRIEIADIVNMDDRQSYTSKRNTFFHELTHSILDTMGRGDLSKDENFVSCFAGFLTEAMSTAEYEEDIQ